MYTEDKDLFLAGLADLVATFAPVIGQDPALLAVEGILADFCGVEATTTPTMEETEATLPPVVLTSLDQLDSIPAPPRDGATGGSMNNVIAALKNYQYSVTEKLNGEVFHIIEHHLKADANNLTLDQLVMALNMARIVKNGKEGKLTLAERVEVAQKHPHWPATTTKKAAREKISEIEKRLEDEHGKYATKAKLAKTKFDTTATYSDEWMETVTDFSENVTTGMTLDDFVAPKAPQSPLDKFMGK